MSRAARTCSTGLKPQSILGPDSGDSTRGQSHYEGGGAATTEGMKEYVMQDSLRAHLSSEACLARGCRDVGLLRHTAPARNYKRSRTSVRGTLFCAKCSSWLSHASIGTDAICSYGVCRPGHICDGCEVELAAPGNCIIHRRMHWTCRRAGRHAGGAHHSGSKCISHHRACSKSKSPKRACSSPGQ